MSENIKIDAPHRKDLALKLLMRHNDVFAGILNTLVFDGAAIVKPEELEDAHHVTSYQNEETLHGMYRDVTKVWKKNAMKLCIVGYENQIRADNRMVFRTIGYDGGDYRDQAEETDDPVPVLTFVLYFGNRPWSGPQSLHEALNIPKGMEPFVSDYHINVVDLMHMSDAEANRFEGDFGFLLNGMRDLSRRNVPGKKPYYLKHKREVLQAMNEFGVRIFDSALQSNMKEGYYTMYHLLSDEERARYEAIGQAKGEAIGQAKGEADGKVKNAASNILALSRNLNITMDKAMELLELTEEEKQQTLEHIKAMS